MKTKRFSLSVNKARTLIYEQEGLGDVLKLIGGDEETTYQVYDPSMISSHVISLNISHVPASNSYKLQKTKHNTSFPVDEVEVLSEGIVSLEELEHQILTYEEPTAVQKIRH